MSQEKFTLITGGSMGIGKAMARECARRGQNLLLVALADDHLLETTRSLRDQFDVRVESLGLDLTRADGPKRVICWLEENDFQVNILINNAGFGRNGIFEERDWEEYQAMIQLNNMAMVNMTYQLTPMLKAQPGDAYILNMSSMEVATPLPYKAVYSGTKNFVYAFSLSLREEFKTFGISVTTVCPGPVVTNEDSLKRIQTQGGKAKMMVLMPDEVASAAIGGLMKGKQLVLPGITTGVLTHLAHWVPLRYKMPLLERMFQQYREG